MSDGAGPSTPPSRHVELFVDPSDVPAWLRPLVDAVRGTEPQHLSALLPPEDGGRESAVLVLLAEGGEGGRDGEPDVLLMERAHTLRQHAGQPAFPGGAVDATDDGPVHTALREAQEEVGLDPATVVPVATLPGLWLPPSGFVVVPVLAWWRSPHPVGVVDEGEVAGVHRVPVSELVDPANRWTVRHPSGWQGPAFDVAGLLVWGFTAGLLDRLLELGSFARPWDRDDVRSLPEPVVRAARRTLEEPGAARRLAQAGEQLRRAGVVPGEDPSP